MKIVCKGKIIDLTTPKVMGIINVTPDSFYSKSRFTTEADLIKQVKQMIENGVDIIDIGGYSSRPGAQEISVAEEKRRLDFALHIINENFRDIIISVDTFRSEIAEYVIENYGVDIINDIGAAKLDSKMLEIIGYYGVPYIMMHMQGTPATMQISPTYKNVVEDIIYFFSERLRLASLFGINDVIIDPGFGFGKTLDHNYELLANLEKFKIFKKPILVGLSRKSMIYKFLNITAEEALTGTIILNTIACLKGANIIRVHDVAEAVTVVKLVRKVMDFESF